MQIRSLLPDFGSTSEPPTFTVSSFEYYNQTFSFNNDSLDQVYFHGFAGGAYSDFTNLVYFSGGFRVPGAHALSYADLMTESPVTFGGFASFAGSTMSSDNTDGVDWYCSGDMACFDSVFEDMSVTANLMDLEGQMSAAHSTFTQLEGILGLDAIGMLSFYQGNFVSSTGALRMNTRRRGRRRRRMIDDESPYDRLLEFEFAGFAAGYEATVDVPANVSCQVNCASRHACYNLTLNCEQPSDCQVECDYDAATGDGHFCPLGTYNSTGGIVTVEDYGVSDSTYLSQFIDYLVDMFDPTVNDVLAVQLTPNLYYQECAIFIDDGSDQVINSSTFAGYLSTATKGADGSFICISGGSYATSGGEINIAHDAVIDLSNINLDGITTLCDGQSTCHGLEFTTNNIGGDGNALLCRGSSACHDISVTGASVVLCSGAGSCEEYTDEGDDSEGEEGEGEGDYRRRLLEEADTDENDGLTNIVTLICSGSRSCASLTVGLTGDNGVDRTTIFALGYQSLRSASIYNDLDDGIVTVVTDAQQALENTVFYCIGENAICEVFCFGYADCADNIEMYGCDESNATCSVYVNDYQNLAEMVLSNIGIVDSIPDATDEPNTDPEASVEGTEGTEGTEATQRTDEVGATEGNDVVNGTGTTAASNDDDGDDATEGDGVAGKNEACGIVFALMLLAHVVL